MGDTSIECVRVELSATLFPLFANVCLRLVAAELQTDARREVADEAAQKEAGVAADHKKTSVDAEKDESAAAAAAAAAEAALDAAAAPNSARAFCARWAHAHCAEFGDELSVLERCVRGSSRARLATDTYARRLLASRYAVRLGRVATELLGEFLVRTAHVGVIRVFNEFPTHTHTHTQRAGVSSFSSKRVGTLSHTTDSFSTQSL